MAVDLGTVADLPAKYQKLATEYSKMRAQVAVLKKAVFEEQSKVVELKDHLKERDHGMRKNEQEMESLQFRNQQLARRVSVLQDELNEMQQKNYGKSKQKGNGESVQTQIANSILGEELQQKIEENARLHQQVYEADFQHQKVVSQLQERLSELERDVKCHDSVVEEIDKRNKTLIEKLQEDKLLFEVKLQSAEKDASESRSRADSLQQQLSITQQSLATKLEQAQYVIQEHLPFVDSRLPSLNSINIPRCSERVREKSTQLITNLADMVHEVLQNLSNCHTYFEQRSLICNNEESAYGFNPLSMKLAVHLHENPVYLKKLENSYHSFKISLETDIFIAVEKTSSFEDFASNLKSYILYLKKLLPYLTLSLEEENNLSWSQMELKKKNNLILDSWHQIIAAFSKIDTYCQLLMCNYSALTKNRAITSVVTAVGDLLNSTKALCSHYHGKVLILKDLPIISDKLKTTEDCIISSLISLVASIKKLYSNLSESMDDIMEEQTTQTFCDFSNAKNKFKLIANYKKKAVQYMDSLDEGPTECVPYKEAVKNRNTLNNSMESRESMVSQLTEAQEKISKLEQLKEYWMLEYQLLKMKHEKLQKKMIQDMDNVSVSSEKTVSPSGESSLGSPLVSNSLLAKLEMESVKESTSISECVETEELRQYFVKRINDLIEKRQMADSKAIAFHSELVAMQRRLLITENSKSELVNQLNTANDTITKLKEELYTTTNNYKSQLSTMSEHLANMNDKLTAQKDEIDDLRFALNNMGSKKNKGK